VYFLWCLEEIINCINGFYLKIMQIVLQNRRFEERMIDLYIYIKYTSISYSGKNELGSIEVTSKWNTTLKEVTFRHISID
jgi:hypothetical protein